jgi:hypothetical protein
MDKEAIKQFIYGGIEELLHDKKFYRYSSVGADYSHLTDEGKIAVVALIDMVAWKMREAENADLNNRAKQQVLDTLKGKNSETV